MTTTTRDLNISRITEQLWTGGGLPSSPSRAAHVVERWYQYGIRAVVDNRLEWSDKGLVAEVLPAIDYLHCPVDDAGQQMPDWWFDTVTSFVDTHLRAGEGVLVHCHMGINRGPSAAFAVLLTQGWDPVMAIETIRRVRPIAAADYAGQALDWWHRTSLVPERERAKQRRRFDDWRAEHPIDTPRLIRQIELGETPDLTG